MRKILFIGLCMILSLSSCSIDDGTKEILKPETIEITDSSVDVTVSGRDQEITLTGLEEGNLYGIMPLLENGGRSITKDRTNRNPLGSYIFEAVDNFFNFTIGNLDLGNVGKYIAYPLQKMVFNRETDMILDFSTPELFRDFKGNRVYMNYYQVDMNDYEQYGIEDPTRVTFVDMILGADGETSAYIFEDIPESKLSWSGVHDFSGIDSFRFLMLAKAEAQSDGQWQIAMRTPIKIDAGDTISLISPATYEIDNTDDELVLELSIPENSVINANKAVEFFHVDRKNGAGFFKSAMKVEEGKIFIHIGKLDHPVYFESYWWNSDKDVIHDELENGLTLRKISPGEEGRLESGKMKFPEKDTYTFHLDTPDGSDENMLKGLFEFADGYDAERLRLTVTFSDGLNADCHIVTSSPTNHSVYYRDGSFILDMRTGERPVEAFVTINGINEVKDPVMTVSIEDISR